MESTVHPVALVIIALPAISRSLPTFLDVVWLAFSLVEDNGSHYIDDECTYDMRESNFAFPAQNRACVCITSQLYDRRGQSRFSLFNGL